MQQFLKTSTILKEVLVKVKEHDKSFICIRTDQVQDEHYVYTFLFGDKRFKALKAEVVRLIGYHTTAEVFLSRMSGVFPSPETSKEFRIMLLEMLIKEYESKGD